MERDQQRSLDSTRPIIAAAILAAGQGSRFGDIKQLADINGEAMLAHVAQQLPWGALEQVTLYLGANAHIIAQQIPANLTYHTVGNWHLGMSASIKAAVHNVPQHVSHLLITLGDQVALKSEDYQALIGACQQQPERIVCAFYNERRAVPAIFPRVFWPELLALEGDSGARKMLASETNVVSLALPQAAIDIDTSQQLARWLQR